MKRTIRDDHRHLRLVLNSRLGISGRREEELVLNLGEIVALPKEGRKEQANEQWGGWGIGRQVVLSFFPMPRFMSTSASVGSLIFLLASHSLQAFRAFVSSWWTTTVKSRSSSALLSCAPASTRKEKNVEKMKLL